MKSDYRNILVTGGRGQLASELERIVKSRGLYAPSSGICGEEGLRESDFIFAGKSDLDICDAKAVGTCIEKNDIGLIINCAAYTAVDKAEEEPEAARRINATGPGVLARQTARYGIPLIHISTDYVFDGKNCRPYTEEDPAHPVSVYGKTKLAGEKAIIRNGCKGVIIRTAWLYSLHGKNFMNTITRLAKEKKTLGVVADQTGTPTNAADLAKAILKITEAGVSGYAGEIFHYSGEGICSWYDFARKIIRLQNLPCEPYPIRTGEYPAAAPRPFYSVLDKDKIKRAFSLEIPHWEDSLESLLKENE